MCDIGDDHYVPDAHNAHVDTREFESRLEELTQGLTGRELDHAELWPRIHALAMNRLAGRIEQPASETLICRYLSPTKFLWFLPQLDLYFGSARAFEDKTDCGIPTDYNHCVQRFFLERDVIPIAWDDSRIDSGHGGLFRAGRN